MSDDRPSKDLIWTAKDRGYSISGAMRELREKGYKFRDEWFRDAWANSDTTGLFRKLGSPQAGIPIGADKPLGPVQIAADDELTEPVQPLLGGTLHAPDILRKALSGKRYVFTSAQNNTSVHSGFMAALKMFCAANDAELIISRFSYNKNGWAKHNGADTTKDDADLWYDTAILPYVLDQQVQIANGLVFCGELDILPTNRYPLAGLDNYTGPNSGIVPHVKMQMRSLAVLKGSDPKFLYTTGTCTLRNYINRRAGQIASFNHVYGALYVEVDDTGSWFARQLNADDDGSFYDLDRFYSSDGSSYAVGSYINLGDIHAEKSDERQLAGALDLIWQINPDGIFIHDLLDFEARNHHNKKDPLFLAEMFYRNRGSVWNNLKQAADVLCTIKDRAEESAIYVIRSNHDEAFKRWLREVPTYPDPQNDLFWHQGNAKLREQMQIGDFDFDIFHWAIRNAADAIGRSLDGIVFVREDESLVIHGIEFGMHGHLGPNGARGNPAGYRQIGRRANTGHTHSASIIDGIYTAGVLASLDMGYNKGPSSWSCSHILTYPNGKRAIITQRGEKWRVRKEL